MMSDENKTFPGNISILTKALFEIFFWSSLGEEGLQGGEECYDFPFLYFITSELSSDVPNPLWVSSSIRTKRKWIIIPGEYASC